MYVLIATFDSTTIRRTDDQYKKVKINRTRGNIIPLQILSIRLLLATTRMQTSTGGYNYFTEHVLKGIDVHLIRNNINHDCTMVTVSILNTNRVKHSSYDTVNVYENRWHVFIKYLLNKYHQTNSTIYFDWNLQRLI